MTLYHGSTIEVREPAILRLDVGRDFGPAFYTTLAFVRSYEVGGRA